LLREFPAGDRVYRISRGAGGSRLQRAFREDQLAAGVIRARVRGGEGVSLRVSFNGALLDQRALGAAAQSLLWRVPRERIQRGLNLLRLESEPPGGVFELLELEAD
jgi:hypothetical protein